MMLSPLRMPGPVGLPFGLALITAVVGSVTELMVVPVPHPGQLPVPAGMLVPKVIESLLATPLPVALLDMVTLLPPVESTKLSCRVESRWGSLCLGSSCPQ